MYTVRCNYGDLGAADVFYTPSQATAERVAQQRAKYDPRGPKCTVIQPGSMGAGLRKLEATMNTGLLEALRALIDNPDDAETMAAVKREIAALSAPELESPLEVKEGYTAQLEIHVKRLCDSLEEACAFATKYSPGTGHNAGLWATAIREARAALDTTGGVQ